MSPTRASILAIFVGVCLVYAETSTVEKASKQVSNIEKGLANNEKLLVRAKEKNNIPEVNCLLQKRNLILGLLRASQRAKEGLSLAAINKDQATVKSYSEKISAYEKSVKEVERSLEECVGLMERKEVEGTTLVYIRPEDEPQIVNKYHDGIWNWDFVPGGEQFPVIPPASPFR